MQISKTKLGAAAGVVTLGGVALGLLGTGVGANFIQSATANANISVGTLDCQLSGSGVTISNNGHTATFTLPQIESSAPGRSTGVVTVTDTGTTNTYVNWTASTSGDLFNDAGVFSPVPAAQNVGLTPGHSANYSLGFQWGTLTNADEGHSGTVTYTANCTDNPAHSDLSFFTQDGGTAGWNSNGTITLGMPTAANNPAGNAGAGVNVLNQVSTLPANPPTFTTDNYAAGSPRWDITFANGDYIFGYPSNAGSGAGWVEMGNSPHPGGGNVPWSEIQSDFSNTSVTSIQIVMDMDQPGASDTISSINYNGNQLLGS